MGNFGSQLCNSVLITGGFCLARGALGEMLLELCPFCWFQRIYGVQGCKIVRCVCGVLLLMVHGCPPKADLRFFNPSRIRAFAVPTGISRCSATSW